MDVTSRMSHYFHRFSQNLPHRSRIRRVADPYALELLRETRFTTFLSIVFPRRGVSWGEVSCSFRRLHRDTPRISRRIKPRLSRDDPAKWSHGGHESISFRKNIAGTNQISCPRFILLFRNVKVRDAPFRRDVEREK